MDVRVVASDANEPATTIRSLPQIDPSPPSITMASTLSDGELYPGKDFTVSQLLYATKKKLRGIALGGRYV